MDQNLEDKLVKRFPKIFKDYRGDMRQTCMAWGLECGNGWFSLIYDLCLDIERVCEGTKVQVVATQVKEKFGGLRFYYAVEFPQTIISKLVNKIRNYMFNHKWGIQYHWFADLKKKVYKSIEEKIEILVDKAEEKSYKICEQCGHPGKLRGKGWMYIMCDKCNDERGLHNDQESIDEESEEND